MNQTTRGLSSPQIPDWLVHLAAFGWRLLASLALALVLLAIAMTLATVTISVLVAVIVGATFAPFVLRLRDRGWSRTKAAGLVTLAALAIITLVAALIALAFIPYAGDILTTVKTGQQTLQASLADLNLPPEVAALLNAVERGIQDWIAGAAASIAGSVGMVVTVAILGGFTTFFVLQDGDRAWVWAMQAAGDWQRERITASGHDALERIGGYLRGTALISGIDAITDFVLMWLLGVPLAGPLAVLVFLGGFIPYLGGLVTTILILLVTYASLGTQATVVLAVLLVISSVIRGNVLRPILYGKTVRIHPAVVIVALPAGAAIAGIIGLFAVIPVVAFASAVTGALVTALGPPPTDAELPDTVVPRWLDRLGQWSWRLLVGIALVGVAVLAAVQIPLVILPIVIAVVLASTFAPLSGALRDRGWGNVRAAAVVTGGAFLLTLAIIVVTFVALVSQGSDIVAQASNGSGSIDQSAGGAAGFLTDVVQTFGIGLLSTIASAVSSVAAIGTVIVLGTLLCFYFLADGDRGWKAATSRLSAWRRQQVDAAGGRAVGVLGGYMIGTGAISAFGALTQLAIMVVLGIPLAIPLAVLSFFGGFIPYIGSLITTGLAFLVTVAVGSPQDVAIMGIYTIVFNIVQGNIVAPLVYSRAVSIHPAIILLAIPAGNEIAGVVGMFLVVPFLGVVATTWRTVLRVFGDPPDRTAEAAVQAPAEALEGADTVPGAMPVAEPAPSEG